MKEKRRGIREGAGRGFARGLCCDGKESNERVKERTEKNEEPKF